MVFVNLSLVAAMVSLVLWLVLLMRQVPTGFIHLLYAAGVVLLVRRIVVGAPRFRS
jgi:hypothetical protein